ncbi:MAG: hypothetical protein Q8K21_10610 [Hydrogenophaga sp.]|jgi:rhodanese-related sulfurtransferase|uniref:hypothetical protein n=1 Tax=Hydrogenophaga sp. TaxID=1904254 RepID=UPI00273024D2|nr:hypothetical protein [Hydrogenophaga sp.]MDP2164647.1 hypothetical protein [Hydrogenophaga sp.]MDP3476711.1 hypothetical protein [Hydrogenophaga sp.]
MKHDADLIAECLAEVKEAMPWNLADRLQQPRSPVLLDLRESHAFDALHIAGSLRVRRGVLEAAGDGGNDTVPKQARTAAP